MSFFEDWVLVLVAKCKKFNYFTSLLINDISQKIYLHAWVQPQVGVFGRSHTHAEHYPVLP